MVNARLTCSLKTTFLLLTKTMLGGMYGAGTFRTDARYAFARGLFLPSPSAVEWLYHRGGLIPHTWLLIITLEGRERVHCSVESGLERRCASWSRSHHMC